MHISGCTTEYNGKLIELVQKEEDIDKLCTLIKGNLMRHMENAERWRKEMLTAREEAYASEEMQKMKKRLKEMESDYYRGFPISESESKAISEWKKEHDTKEHRNPNQYHGCSGGGYSYEFYPTAIGTSGVCICGTCRRLARDAVYKTGKYDAEAYKKYMKDHNGEFEFQELG